MKGIICPDNTHMKSYTKLLSCNYISYKSLPKILQKHKVILHIFCHNFYSFWALSKWSFYKSFPTNHVIQRRYAQQFSALHQCMYFIFLTLLDTVISLPYVLKHLLTHKLTSMDIWMHTRCWQPTCPSPFLIAGCKSLSSMSQFSPFLIFHLFCCSHFPLSTKYEVFSFGLSFHDCYYLLYSVSWWEGGE